MKKLFLMLLASTLFSFTAVSQKLATEKVPDVVKAAFTSKFPDAVKVSWELENANEFEANFQLNNKETSANFDNAGNCLETEIEIKVADLPMAVQETLKKDFSGMQVNEASKIESAKYGSCFEAEVKNGNEKFDILLSADGKILSKSKSDDD